MKKRFFAITLVVMFIFSLSSTSIKATDVGGKKNCWNSCRWNPVHGDCYTWGIGSYCGLMKASGSAAGACVDCGITTD
jgi:hypothetical protein